MTRLSPDAARAARRVLQDAVEGLPPGSPEHAKALEKGARALAERGIEVGSEALKALGADFGDRDPGLRALRETIRARTGDAPSVVRGRVGRSLGAAVRRLRESAEGAPAHVARGLVSPDAYREVSAARLENAELLWLNTELLAERGLATPAEADTEQFRQAVLDAFAWSVPREGEAGFREGETKAFAVDYQGGEGNWGTLGSGRAMSAGSWQIKGGGDTELSLKSGSKIGGLDLATGISEAILGEVNHRELPHGGNRILALVATGTHTKTESGEEIPRILAVREDPLRPSQYMLGELDRVYDPEHTRARANLDRILEALPADEEPGLVPREDESRVLEGLRAYTRRVAEQYGAAFVKRLYHGATSPSNAQLDGGWLDYDLQTAQPGHGKIQVLFSEAAFGETHTIKKLVVEDFALDVLDHFDALRGTDTKPLMALFDETFERSVEKEMLHLTGVPSPLVEELAEIPAARSLGAALAQVARTPLDGNRRAIHVDMEGKGPNAMPERTSEHDLGAILVALARCPDKTPFALARAVDPHLPDSNLRGPVAASYAAFHRAVAGRAREAGVDRQALRRLLTLGAEKRNTPMEGVFRPVLKGRIAEATEKYRANSDPKPMTDLIDDTIRGARRTFPDVGPWSVALEERRDAEGGVRLEVFDAVRNATVERPLDSEARAAQRPATA